MPSASSAVDLFLAEAAKGDDAYIESGWIPPEQRSREVHRAADRAIADLPRPLASAVVAEEGLADDPEIDAKLDHGVFFWEYEEAVFGEVFDSLLQTIGDCVSMGMANAVQDGLTIDAFLSAGLLKPVRGVATEPIYAGSRVEVGGGRLSGDGSLGSWAAKWIVDWGVLLRQAYGSVDLTTYSGQKARQWGRRGAGCPDSIEDDAKLHPVPETTLCTSVDQAVPILVALNGITVASNAGFERQRRPGGWCRRVGRWMHQMAFRGVFRDAAGCIWLILQNSWGDYLGSLNNTIETASGRTVTLPQGAFAIAAEDADHMLRQQDSFGVASPLGWRPRASGLLVRQRVGLLATVAQHLAA